MENENKGFLFYSSYYEAVKQLDADTRLEIYEAIMNFALEDKEPTLTGFANIVFALIRPTITSSINRYQACVENGKKGGAPLGNQNAKKDKNNPQTTQKQPKNNLNKDKDKDKNKDIDKEREKEREKNTEKDVEMENDREKIFLSLTEIQNFQNAFPNRKLDLDKLPAVPPNFDMTKLIQHINQSTFLTSANNMGLASCLKNYDAIISGNYADFAKPPAPPPKESWERQYSFADLDALFDNPEDIEV